LFNSLQPVKPILGTRDSSGAALSQKAGAGAQTTRGGPGAAPRREVRAGATGTRGGLGASSSRQAGAGAVGTRDSLGAAPSRKARAGDMWRPWSCPEPGGRSRGLRTRGHALSFVLTWSLYERVPDPQGTDSGPQAHPGRGCEPTGGPNILSRAAILSLVRWDFEAVVQHS
jgi:hypothetical protein